MDRTPSDFAIVATCAVALVVLSSRLAAHDAHTVGAYRLEIGWGEEPAFSGVRNAVVVDVTEAKGGAPVIDLDGGSLSVEVSFGAERMVLPLQQAFDRRHEFRAWLIPTRAGTFTFHITGRIRNQPIDITSSCSDKTFDCVVDESQIQFPARDPSAGQLAERIDRALPRAEGALAAAARARTTGLAAIGVSILALLTAVGAVLRGRRTG